MVPEFGECTNVVETVSTLDDVLATLDVIFAGGVARRGGEGWTRTRLRPRALLCGVSGASGRTAFTSLWMHCLNAEFITSRRYRTIG
jgi:hypothetical protein